MTLHHRIPRTQHLHPILVLATMIAGTAVAADELAEITVTATRMGHEAVSRQIVGRSSSTGAPVEHLTLSWTVAYADLDLSTHSGATALEQRIHARARAVCRELDRLLPLEAGDQVSCVQGAVDGAIEQAHRVIAVAESRHAASSPK